MSKPSIPEIAAMSHKDLQTACNAHELKASGTIEVLRDRLIRFHHPTSAARSSRQDPEFEPEPQYESLAEIGLSDATIAALGAENVTEVLHFSVLSVKDSTTDIVKQPGDRNRLIRIVEPAKPEPKASGSGLKVNLDAKHNRVVLLDDDEKVTDKAKKRRRSRSRSASSSPSSSRSRSSSSSSSSSSASNSSDSSAGKSRKRKSKTPSKASKLPYEARELPRPHEFVSSRACLGPNGKSKKKIDALDISIQEFWAGNLNTTNRLVQSDNPKHEPTKDELVDYLEYLGNKQKDYFAAAVMRFDEEFRTRAIGEGLALNDVAKRKAVAASHFNSTTAVGSKATYAANTNAQASSNGNQARKAGTAVLICGNYNSAAGCRGACNYRHECQKRGERGHSKHACPPPRASNA